MQNNNNLRGIWNYIPILLVASLILMMMTMFSSSGTKNYGYSELQTLVETKQVQEVQVTVSNVVLDITGKYVEDGKVYEFTARVPNTDEIVNQLMNDLQAKGVDAKTVDAYQTNVWVDTLITFLPYVALLAGGYFIFTRMNNSAANKGMEVGKTRARLESNIRIRFTDVAGADEEKEEMVELIEYLKNPKRFSKMGARIPKGVLLSGPPGTGKTLLARAVAGEADVPFYSISGSDFVEMFVGVGASRVRDMFKKAKQTAPCIIFIDEIDAVGRERGAGLGGGHDEREQTLNQLLVEMDGINDNTGILMIAATNRPDVLDPALLRPGRFDRQIIVNLPDRKGRKEILEVHARNKKMDPSVDLNAIAKRTPGFSGADLENVLNESAILAVRENKTTITVEEIDEAIDRVMMGPAKKSRTYSTEEKRRVAYHEAGHAVIGLHVNDANIVRKVTIIPRGMAGGYNMMTPKEEKMLSTKSDLMARITGYMGGRVAEELVLGEITTGASNDIQEATKIARAMVVELGMSKLGPIQYQHASGNVFLGRDYTNAQNYSGEVAYEIDKEIRDIIETCYAEAKQIITKYRDELENIADALVEYETLTAEQIDDIVAGKSIGKIIDSDSPSVEEKVEEAVEQAKEEKPE